jgi:hypothetical protein
MKWTITALALVLAPSGVFAEEKLGITVYPGAKVHSQDTSMVKQIAADGACYRTSDPKTKVAEFYAKFAGVKPLLPPPGVITPATVFQKGQDIQVRVQTAIDKPQETMLCIVKE